MAIGVRVQEKGQITIPTKIRRKLNLRKGDLVIFTETSEGVLIQPAEILSQAELRKKLAEEIGGLRSRFGQMSDKEIETLVTDAIRGAREK
ncbi:MAG: AbrB/MazE/SpoVT family DNA-binding domain-containing protein [Anaerolineales bacterium]|nr:AbrB/MazE/SpoVT family DNA-binding domain-containing protein [Anaerolineales bacterium]MCX7755168.1 AbrB/MazE/SpoVT family DNA-binding domain-containing protein [Anaerolineales bacterium]MDW8277834.1 AbrB/MazE/SpoVT family DNA-binding domain-containing protein [Anaerolineales bacterium]